MDFNSTTVIKEAFKFDPTEYYQHLSHEFSKYHQDPTNVGLHFVTTPLAMIGAFSILHAYTSSSSMAMSLIFFYLLSLLPTLPNGVFAGTVILCGVILSCARQLKLGFKTSIAFVVLGYLLQDLAHLGTGEQTFQSTYSAGGHIDLSNPISWLFSLFEQCYYLLPLCVHIALPILHRNVSMPNELKDILEAPLPIQMQRLHAFTWLLGPLICCALGSYCLDSKNSFCFFPGSPYFYRVLQCNLQDENSRDNVVLKNGDKKNHESRAIDLDTIRSWVIANNPSEATSSHWWFTDLKGATREAFERCMASTQIESMFRSLFSVKNYCMDPVIGMNEIYVTGPAREGEVMNSDHVFYTRHVDGPFGLVPFVSVYRLIIGLDKNEMITTHFPLAHLSHNACKGDVLAFDFNREVHYITCDESKRALSDKFRVVLKLHYCIYPRVLAPMGWLMNRLNTNYNMGFRALFLKTINPRSMYEHFLAWNVNFNTILFDKIETLLGQRNVIYIFFVLALWKATGVYEVFFALTSFVHYFRYISTYYVRRGIDFGSFKRDVLLFKTLALVQLFYHYLCPSVEQFVLDPISILMIIAGYTVSLMATNAIGIDRTYFGAELGLVESKWIDEFPYGYIPHPMIVSQVFALLGLYKASHFRTEWPYVVPIHILLYVTHMLQEHFDIYQKHPIEEKQMK